MLYKTPLQKMIYSHDKGKSLTWIYEDNNIPIFVQISSILSAYLIVYL